MSDVTIAFKPSRQRYEEILEVEAKTKVSYPEAKKRFDPAHASLSREQQERLVKEQIRAVPSVVREIADLMCSCLHPFDIRGKTALFVIGATGAGKSTLCNWLVGHKFSVDSQVVESDFGDDDVVNTVVTTYVGEGRRFVVGDVNESKTFVPNVFEMSSQKNKLLIDFPGFFDTSAFDVRIGMDLGFRRLVNAFQGRVRIIALVAVQNFDTSCARAESGRMQLQKMLRLVPTSSTTAPLRGEGSRFCIGISRCDTKFAQNAQTSWRNMQAQVRALDDVLAGSTWNANKHIFERGKDFQTPSAFLSMLDSDYAIASCLRSDCLDYRDVQYLQKYLVTEEYTGKLMRKIMAKVGAPDYQEERKQFNGMDAPTLIKRAKLQSARVTKFSTWITESSKVLLREKKMALGFIDEDFRWMENENQPRLTKVLAQVEQIMMKRILAVANQMFEDMQAHINDLIKKEIIIGEDKKKVQTAIEDTSKALDGLAEAAGYQSKESHKNEILLGGTAVVVAAGGATVVTAAVSASAFAVAGLMTGGVSVLIAGGVAGLAAYHHKTSADKAEAEEKIKAEARKTSNQIARIQIDALAKYNHVGAAAVAHLHKLDRTIDEMNSKEAK